MRFLLRDVDLTLNRYPIQGAGTSHETVEIVRTENDVFGGRMTIRLTEGAPSIPRMARWGTQGQYGRHVNFTSRLKCPDGAVFLLQNGAMIKFPSAGWGGYVFAFEVIQQEA